MSDSISNPVALASVIAVMAMIAAIILHSDDGGSDDYLPEI
jgi:hypothetical protein